jgi:predicted ester cyclase
VNIEERNKQVIYESLEATDKREYDVVRKYYHPDFIEHNPDSVVHIANARTGLEKAFRLLDKIFPVRRHVIEDIIAEGDKVAARITFTATARDLPDFPINNKETSITGTAIYRFEDGLIIEKWTQVSVLKELGISMNDLNKIADAYN